MDKELAKMLHIALISDQMFIGEVYSMTKQGLTPKDIANKIGHKNPSTIISSKYALRALFGKEKCENLKYNSSKILRETVRRILKNQKNPPELSIYLESILIQINTPEKDKKNNETIVSEGVYVYSYPQYLSMELVHPEGKALYKIGASSNLKSRIDSQRRKTEVPEDLVIVRAFICEDPFKIESKFHTILNSASLHHKTKTGGVEWFNCNIATIDAIAEALEIYSEI